MKEQERKVMRFKRTSEVFEQLPEFVRDEYNVHSERYLEKSNVRISMDHEKFLTFIVRKTEPVVDCVIVNALEVKGEVIVEYTFVSDDTYRMLGELFEMVE